MRHTSYFVGGWAVMLVATSISLGDATIRTVPEKMHEQQPLPVWVADNETQYTANVHLNNTGLGGEPTDAVQWKFLNTPGFNFTEVTLPTYNDFFEGIPMFYELISPPGQLSMRVVEEIGGGPVDHQGYLAVYKFRVLQSTTPGWYNFDLNSVHLYNPEGQYQPFTEIHEPVWIAPINPADFHHPPEITRDGYIDQADFQFLADNMNGPGYASPADIDGNGSADIADFARFQRCYTGTEPVSLPGCE